MPADNASYIVPFPADFEDNAHWYLPVQLGAELVQANDPNAHNTLRYVICVPTKGYLDRVAIRNAFSADILRSLDRHGVVDYVDGNFPGVTFRAHLMTLRVNAPAAKMPVLAIYPTPKLLEVVEEREVSELVVVPWLEDDIAEWIELQGPQEIEVDVP